MFRFERSTLQVYEEFAFGELFDEEIFAVIDRRQAYIYICSRLLACSILDFLTKGASIKEHLQQKLQNLLRQALDETQNEHYISSFFYGLFEEDAVKCINERIIFICLVYLQETRSIEEYSLMGRCVFSQQNKLKYHLIESIASFIDVFMRQLEDDLQDINDIDRAHAYKCGELCDNLNIHNLIHAVHSTPPQ